MKALYAYFGLLRPHQIDSPGHSNYQLGLMDSIRSEFEVTRFDFFSYYPEEIITSEAAQVTNYPDTGLGQIFQQYLEEMVEERLGLEQVLENISKKAYSSIFLKARFRNLSTLRKKWKDARAFEKIIEVAVTAGYTPGEIIILDTDLSLSNEFKEKIKGVAKILIPSVDFPAISRGFLNRCVETNLSYFDKHKNIVFYGNIDTSSYKAGNSKSGLLGYVINHCENRYLEPYRFTVISKEKDLANLKESTNKILRNNRFDIFTALERSLVMLNVTKEKYNDVGFVPARIYEAMIFGMIPVSYKFSFLCETFSFNSIEELDEILLYLEECEIEDLKTAYLHFIDSYLKWVESKDAPLKHI